MSVIGHFVEAAGVPTAGISLIREHSVALRPPRTLWVPFPLGRPFGAPNESAFQSQVLGALLALFEHEHGPVVLSDFGQDAPAPAPESRGRFCTLELPRADACNDPLPAASAEMALLRPWHNKRMSAPGARTITGASGLTPDGILALLGEFLHNGSRQMPAGSAVQLWPELLRLSVEELRHWCVEAAMTESGENFTMAAIDDWFWGETAAGALILAVQAKAAGSDESDIQRVANAALVPAAQQHRILGSS